MIFGYFGIERVAKRDVGLATLYVLVEHFLDVGTRLGHERRWDTSWARAICRERSTFGWVRRWDPPPGSRSSSVPKFYDELPGTLNGASLQRQKLIIGAKLSARRDLSILRASSSI